MSRARIEIPKDEVATFCRSIIFDGWDSLPQCSVRTSNRAAISTYSLISNLCVLLVLFA